MANVSGVNGGYRPASTSYPILNQHSNIAASVEGDQEDGSTDQIADVAATPLHIPTGFVSSSKASAAQSVHGASASRGGQIW
jgi:hypothetical protein